MTNQEKRDILLEIVAGYLLDNSPVTSSKVSVEQLVEWNYFNEIKKGQQQVEEPEVCGSWPQGRYAGSIDGERGSVAWSAPFTSGKLVVISICPEGCIDGSGEMLDSFTKLIHSAGLNEELESLSRLFEFDWMESLRIAQGL